MIALADVKPGDLDPTGGPDPDLELFQCPWSNGARRRRDELFCTRLDGHPGPHISGDGVAVLAVWS